VGLVRRALYRSPSTNALPCFPLPCRRGSSTLYVEEAAAAAVLSVRSRSARRRTCVSAWTDSPLVAARRSPRQTPRRARRGACGCPHGRLGQKSRLEYAGAAALVVAARVSKANSTAAVGPSDSAAASAVLLLGMLASRGPHDATYQHRRHRGANATDHATANVTAHATTHVTGLATGNCQRSCHWPRSRQSHRHSPGHPRGCTINHAARAASSRVGGLGSGRSGRSGGTRCSARNRAAREAHTATQIG